MCVFFFIYFILFYLFFSTFIVIVRLFSVIVSLSGQVSYFFIYIIYVKDED